MKWPVACSWVMSSLVVGCASVPMGGPSTSAKGPAAGVKRGQAVVAKKSSAQPSRTASARAQAAKEKEASGEGPTIITAGGVPVAPAKATASPIPTAIPTGVGPESSTKLASVPPSDKTSQKGSASPDAGGPALAAAWDAEQDSDDQDALLMTDEAEPMAGAQDAKPAGAPPVPEGGGRRAADYSWVEGKLIRVHSRGGSWRVRYAPYHEADTYGGQLILVGTVAKDLQDGDLVRVEGQVQDYDAHHVGTRYAVRRIQLVRKGPGSLVH